MTTIIRIADHMVILRAYNRSQGKPLTIEALGMQYPRYSIDSIIRTGVFLEKAGWIEPVPEGGYRITATGKNHLDRCNT